VSQRTEKVQKVAKEILGESIQTLKDPRIGFVTVTAVRVTPDLRSARVFVSVFGSPEEQAETMAGLESAKPFLRSEIGKGVRLRYLPELVFHRDEGPEVAERIEEILHKIHHPSEEPEDDE
jgi:ribosome-binding factor A